MKSIKQVFHLLSYLQYPLVIAALYFSLKPIFYGYDYIVENTDIIFKNYNLFLIFLGLGISFSTLQDTSKSPKYEKKIWKNPKHGKVVIIWISIITLLTLAYGIFGYFITDHKNVKELSIGAIVLGIGLIGFLKTATEVYDHHKE